MCVAKVTPASAKTMIAKKGDEIPALFVAAENGFVETFKAILENGVSIDVTTRNGVTLREYLANIMNDVAANARSFDAAYTKIAPILLEIGRRMIRNNSKKPNSNVFRAAGAAAPAAYSIPVNTGGPAGEVNPFMGGRRKQRKTRSNKKKNNKNKRTKSSRKH